MPLNGYKPWLSLDVGVKGAASIKHYLDKRHGYKAARKAMKMTPDEVIKITKASGLRGRGGAGFSTGLKFGFVPKKSKKPRYVVLNADESEPGCFKDRALMTYSPHLVIEGTIIACKAIESHHAYIYIRGEYAAEARIMQKAIDEAYKQDFLGEGVFNTKYKLDMTVHRGAGAYICGEETGMLSSLEGQRGYPKIKPPFPAVEGAFGCPTIVNNVETLANLPFIFREGADAFMKIGPKNNVGHKLYCLSGHVKKPGLYEAPMSITMKELVMDLAGGIVDGLKPKAVVPGGLSMPVMPWQEIEQEDVRMDFDTVEARGSYLGAAGVIVMHEKTCMVNALYNTVRFYHHESCGQCTPCREGTAWADKVLRRIMAGKGRLEDIDLLDSMAAQMVGTTICFLSDSCAMPIQSYIEKFRDEFEYFCKHGKSMVKDAIEL